MVYLTSSKEIAKCPTLSEQYQSDCDVRANLRDSLAHSVHQRIALQKEAELLRVASMDARSRLWEQLAKLRETLAV